MPKIVAMKPTLHNTVVLIVEVSSHGGGGYYFPTYLKVVEIEEDTKYYSSRGKNVVEVHNEALFNARSTRGPRSQYGYALKESLECFNSIN